MEIQAFIVKSKRLKRVCRPIGKLRTINDINSTYVDEKDCVEPCIKPVDNEEIDMNSGLFEKLLQIKPFNWE